MINYFMYVCSTSSIRSDPGQFLGVLQTSAVSRDLDLDQSEVTANEK